MTAREILGAVFLIALMGWLCIGALYGAYRRSSPTVVLFLIILLFVMAATARWIGGAS